jgi:regulator of cell morphogenesis and NO signaling
MATATQSIREIVANQPFAVAILERFEIDLCAHANDSLSEACAQLQLSTEQVLDKLEESARVAGEQAIDLEALSPSRLIQHIVRTHHQYIRRELPRLKAMASKVAGKHGARAPELKRVAVLMEQLQAELFAHIEKEELILFPFIAQVDQETAAASATGSGFQTVRQPVAMMIREHDAAGTTLEEIRLLAEDFTPPAWACLTHIAFCAGLRDFAADLNRHIELEDNILFPHAIAMEAELATRR